MTEDKKPENEKPETEATETDTSPAPEKAQKMLPQAEVDKLMAKQRREHAERLAALQKDYDEYKAGVEAEKKAANDAAEAKVKELRKDLPEGVIKLLDKLTPIEQLDWLSDPANIVEKKTIGKLPQERGDHGAPPRAPIVF